MGIEVYSIISTVITLICGGGWFINWRAKKRQENAKAKQEEATAKQTEADAFKSMQDAYQQTLDDVLKTLDEARQERDHYKDERNDLRKENGEMREKVKELEGKMTELELNYKKDVSRIGRRLDVLSPFLCGVAGCMNRTKVSLMENIDDNSFATAEERASNAEHGNY